MLLFFLSIAVAQDSISSLGIPLREPLREPLIETVSHGPDKPPPSDGYEFKGKKGGNAKGKLGMLLLLSSSIPALSARSLESGSAEQIEKKNKAMYMAGIGLGLILWERFQD